MGETTVWGEIEGQVITFPMKVGSMDTATLVFSVPVAAAQSLLPGNDFEVIEVIEGVAQMVVALCDYADNPWGDYLELNLGFLARPRGAGEDVIGSFVYRMPVDQEFTCKAGNLVMGFPKTVEDLRMSSNGGRVSFDMYVGGALEVGFSFDEPEQSGEPSTVETVSYSYLNGEPFGTPLKMQMGTAMIDPQTVRIELGRGPIATELRNLGLDDKRPDFGTWGTGLSATFELGQPI